MQILDVLKIVFNVKICLNNERYSFLISCVNMVLMSHISQMNTFIY